MKKLKTFLALSLTFALIFSSMGSVFAYQYDGTDYDGIQVNDTFYSLGYITGNETAFGDTFGPADSKKVILDFNNKAAKFSDYLAANPADFDAWASNTANQTAATPDYFVKADGTKVPVVPQRVTVKSVTVVNSTTINVIFSDNITKSYTGYNLVPGSNVVTFSYNDQNFTETVVVPQPTKATVNEVKLVDYRHMQVTFSTEVDAETAADPANYYLEVVEGSAEYGAPAYLGISNQLSTIDTDYIDWWTEDHITANVVDGKTVVDIYLPEDSRFTNELDLTSNVGDDERTIIANIANLVNFPVGNDSKEMIKDMTTNVAVRNVRDLDGERTINTKVLPMLIQDNIAPQFKGLTVLNDLETGARQTVTMTTEQSEVAIEFNEPVFDTHGLGVDDINNTKHYNVAVYVDNILVGSTEKDDLENVMTFNMSRYGSYDEARFATLNVRRAVTAAYGEDAYKACRDFRISVIGITDLAGNTQVPNPIEFTAKITDPDPNNPDPADPVIPEVLRIKQIHDNAFRVYFNRAGVTANFEITNADGEDGVLDVAINGQVSEDTDNDDVADTFYTDVFVPAVDIETTVDNAINGKNNGILAYDDQNKLIRKVRVYNVKVPSETLEGAAYCNPSYEIFKDVYAPEYEESPITVENTNADIEKGILRIHLEDRVPDAWDVVGQPVYAMLYDYNYGNDNVFEPTINVDATEEYNDEPYMTDLNKGADLLPVKVSYVDNSGATHAVLVTNKWLSEDFRWMYMDWPLDTSKPGWNEGYTGAISYDPENQDLVLDLSNYKQLTEDGQLVQGVTYKVEIPDGYFTDPAKYDAYDVSFKTTSEFPEPILDQPYYVSDGRQNNIGEDKEESFVVRGYVANEAKLDMDIEEDDPPVDPPVDDAVPQTSKLLINYAQEANQIWVEFTGQIKQSTLEEADNYMINGKTLAEMGLDDSAIKYVKQVGDYEDEVRQFAKIELGYDTIPVSGDYTFDVFGVTNEAGGMMTPVSTRIDLIENTRPTVELTKISGDNQIVLTFDEALMFGDDVDDDAINAGLANVDNFEVILDDGAPVTPVTAVLSEEDHKTVTLTMTGIDLSNYDSIIVNIVPDQNDQLSLEDISDNHNPIKVGEVTIK